ncbi:transposase [Streptomyces sp. B-S-A8]|uniref:Transposase n=1 Tax=Streptomyces solicavernae TaxID=3043614 RepID=A0ABT6RZV4_9ACTN|nr:transposase [Streptomyces sp. B-S-A8]MDI3389975.1 transposase [Streptomyces sp. B-S-A8]
MPDRPDTAEPATGPQLRKTGADGGLDALTRRLFREFPRADQRRWAASYVSGLLDTPGKKSVRNMGRSVSASHTAPQSLHQVVNESTWPWNAVRRELFDWCREHAGARGLTLARIPLPKRGNCSAGVHRRFDAASGRTISCQLGLSLFLLTDRGAVPVDWRLYLPENWVDDASLRRRVRIPDATRAHTPGRLLLDLAAYADGAGLDVPLAVEAETVAEAVELVAGLGALDAESAVAVPLTTPVSAVLLPGARRAGAAAVGGGRPTAGGLAEQLAATAQPLPAPGAAGLRLLPAVVHTSALARPMRLIGSWRPGERRPDRVWLTGADEHRLHRMVPLLAHPGAAQETLHLLDDCGMRDFEGRSYPGWHRHMTLVGAACSYRVLGGGTQEEARPVERTSRRHGAREEQHADSRAAASAWGRAA